MQRCEFDAMRVVVQNWKKRKECQIVPRLIRHADKLGGGVCPFGSRKWSGALVGSRGEQLDRRLSE